jgi:hypothetical protein
MTLSIILGSLLTIVVVVLGLVLYNNTSRFSGHLEDLQDIYNILGSIEKETPIDRCLIFMTKNSGSKPTPGVPIYVTCLYEGPGTQERQKYQNIRVDEEYVAMMLKLKRDQRIDYITEEMEYSLLKRIYISEKVTFSVAFFIHEDSKAFYYGSFASHSMKHVDPETDVKIDLAISQLQYIWRKPKNNHLLIKIKV